MKARLKEKYDREIVPQLCKQFGFKTMMQAPRLEKIVINMGVGKAHEDIKILEGVMDDLGVITGQKPVMTRSKKAIANFKIRKGVPIGCKVTLRRNKMYEFLDRLINVALPRIKDFRGVPDSSFDGAGNYTIGVSEQAIFPELEVDKVKYPQGMDIIMVIKAKKKEHSRELLKLFGMPFRS